MISGNGCWHGGNAGRAGGPRGQRGGLGRQRARAVPLRQIGWAEQDPEDWWRAAQRGHRRCHRRRRAGWRARSSPSASPARCTAASCSTKTAKSSAPRSSGATSAPSRSATGSNAKIGRERLIELTCNPALPNFTLTKLLWVRDHEPEIFAHIAHVLCPKDYVRYRLTGEYAIDMQEASGTLLLDVAHRRWSDRGRPGRGHSAELAARGSSKSPEICAQISDEGAAAPASPPELPLPRAQAIRVQAPSAWESSSPVRSPPPSAPPAWSSPPPTSPP